MEIIQEILIFQHLFCQFKKINTSFVSLYLPASEQLNIIYILPRISGLRLKGWELTAI